MKAIAIAALLLISGCANSQSATESKPTSAPTDALKGATPVDGTCLPSADTLAGLPVDQVRRGRAIPAAIRNGVARVVAIPGIARSACGAGTALVIVTTKSEVIAAVAGPLAAGGNDFWLNEDGIPVKARVVGRATDPDLVILRAPCERCAFMRAAKTKANSTDNMILAGYTDGSAEVIAHPTRTADAPYNFRRGGSLDTWVFSLVPDAASSGDGVWTSDGKIVGLSYAEEQDMRESTVHRIIYIPAGDVINAARAAVSGK